MQRLKQHNLIYLATPYTKYRHGIREAFRDASKLAGHLMAQGLPILSPIAHSHPLASYAEIDHTDQAFWMKTNEPFIKVCDALLVGRLEGWGDSSGVAYEIREFLRDGKPVYHLNLDTMELA